MPAWLIAFGAGFKSLLDAIPALQKIFSMFQKSTEEKVQDAEKESMGAADKFRKTGRPSE